MGIEQPPVQEYGRDKKRIHAEKDAGYDRHRLFGAGTEAKGVMDFLWRQQADEMTQEQEQDAHVEELGAMIGCRRRRK